VTPEETIKELEKLVKGPWKYHDSHGPIYKTVVAPDVGGTGAVVLWVEEQWAAYRRVPAVGQFLCEWSAVAAVELSDEWAAPTGTKGSGVDPVSALRSLLYQPVVVGLLSALDAFPEVDLPQEGWPFWWRDDSLFHVKCWFRIKWSDFGPETVWSICMPGRWQRAPAYPGWKP
jgi:hypothetical protein